MIDVSATGFDIDKVDLNAITAADIKPIPPRLLVTSEEREAHEKLHAAAARNKVRGEMAAKQTAERARINAAVKTRCDAIHALTPKRAEELAAMAMRDGKSVEHFKAMLAEWRQQQVAEADEAAAQSILAAFRAV